MPYDEGMIRRQQSFKQGVLEFQTLWHQAARQCPGLLADGTEFPRRLLAEVDREIVPVLGRATAFPLQEEVKHFGSLALDDCYFEDAYKPLCGEKDLEALRTRGLGHIMASPGIHWPHGVYHKENPHTAREFFSIGKSLLFCKSDGDDDGVKADLSVILPSGRHPAVLGECLSRLKAVADQTLRLEVIVMVPPATRA